MKISRLALLVNASLIALTSAGYAADLPTKKEAAPVTPVSACASVQDFFVTACPLTYKGITLYGTVDIGAGYQTHTAPFNGDSLFGVPDFIQKMNRGASGVFVPNGLSQSVIGIKAKEEFAPGWSFVGTLETGYDPDSLHLANGPRSIYDNTNVLPLNQSAWGDSSRGGQFDNSQGFVGVSNSTFGTLLAGRVNSLTLDGVNAYDPMAGSYAFSPIGFSGTTAGAGDTENARYDGFKYRVEAGKFRFGALAQVGGYEQGNSSAAAYELQVGGDFYGLSLDGIFTQVKDAEALAPYSSAPPVGVPSGALKMTQSNDTSLMLLAKYTWGGLKVYGGFEDVVQRNPSDANGATAAATGGELTTLGNFVGVVQKLSYTLPKTLQVYWTGARYSITPDIDLAGAYYRYHQLNYSGGELR